MDRIIEKEMEDLDAMKGKGIILEPRKTIKIDMKRYDGYHKLTLEEQYTCHRCGHFGADVGHVEHSYIGGIGFIYLPICDDVEACDKRQGSIAL